MIQSRKCLLFLLTLISALAIHPALSRAATFCVNEQLDDGTGNAADCPDAACDGSPGDCSLRDAVLNANLNADEDIIVFSSSLTSPLMVAAAFPGLPTIRFPLQINGPGADVLTVAIGNGSNRVFWFDAEEQPRSYSISGLTVTNLGDSGFPNKIIHHRGTLTISDSVITGRGRGISSFGEELTINRSSISDNFTASSDGATGAGLNFGSGVEGGILTINDSTFSGNQKLNTGAPALDEGGGAIGIFDGSSLFEGTDINVTLTNVTISENETNENGGGLWISDDCAECGSAAGIIHVTFNNVTIADNTADQNADGQAGGGLFVSLSNPGASVTLNNTILADNVSGSGNANDCSVSGITLTSNGSNLVGDPSSCPGLQAGSDITGEDPLLASLALNAPGSTMTHALDSGSPALNAADDADCPATDQRGIPRPQGSACDIGAYEAVVCGDGSVGPGEECEPGGCCTDECLFAAAGTSCDDGDPDTIGTVCTGSSAVCGGGSNGDGGGGCSLGSRGGLASLSGLGLMLAILGGLALLRRSRPKLSSGF